MLLCTIVHSTALHPACLQQCVKYELDHYVFVLVLFIMPTHVALLPKKD